ncbi:MAG: hypothetical protein ACI89L_001446 [Phycisphaerales bacterium]
MALLTTTERRADDLSDTLAGSVADMGAVIRGQATEATLLREQLAEAEREADRPRVQLTDDGIGVCVLRPVGGP